MAASTTIFSDIKTIFSAEKIVPNRLMNVLGCQVGRLLLAKGLLWKRRRKWLTEVTEIERSLIRDGVVLIPNFFDSETFEQLLCEVDRNEAAFLADKPAIADKFGIVRQQITLHKRPNVFPLSNNLFFNNELLLRVVRSYEGWKSTDNFFNTGTVLKYEKLVQKEEPASASFSNDNQISSGDLHADTFHFVTKAFLTLNDMTTNNSPYSYCYGSHTLNRQRLIWEYLNSIKSNQYHGEYYNRVYTEQIKTMGLKIIPIEAKKNTLIITDTFGFHFRGQMTRKDEIRRMLRMDFRSNPFRFK